MRINFLFYDCGKMILINHVVLRTPPPPFHSHYRKPIPGALLARIRVTVALQLFVISICYLLIL